jgi:hypothetical protein
MSLDSGGNDCNDADESVHPGAQDDCDGVDNNCNGLVDDGQAQCGCAVDGDLNGDVLNTVVDVQCSILVALWSLAGGGTAVPICLANASLATADLNCDVVINVLDVVLTIDLVLEAPFGSEIDVNGDGCVDTCHVPL